MSNVTTMPNKMDRELLSLVKIYIGSVIDILLFGVAAWDGVDHVLRSISAVGAIVVLIYLIRKHRLEYSVRKTEHQIKKIELEKERRWFQEKYGDDGIV